ncbi:hypothetical protein GTP81_08495 [Rugamonas sp. FT107W]|uniref:Uncharacterized protein n=1 Tax=Duganella vulcania TaxID=2692166 RepID=A0A845HDA0_9BURK|nr:hypothetical protein [Duganella vulcania]MYN16790.1 hypothetical protein [Duganella vulcania]
MKPSQPIRANWGHGRLRPLESLANFSAAFCKLNGTSYAKFAKFIKNYLGIQEWPPASLDAAGVRKLCVLLDEPEDVIGSVIPPFAWQSSHPILSALQAAATHTADLYFCSECVAEGYHSALHEVPWMRSCAIHHVGLSRAPVAAVGGARFHRYCSALTTCLREAKTGWPQSPADDQADRIAHMMPLTEICDWMTQARSRLAELGDVLWVTGQLVGDMDVGTALGIMAALVPAPPRFGEVAIPHQALKLTIEHFESSILAPIEHAALAIGEICWLHRLTNLKFRRREIEPRLHYLNDWTARTHPTCKCAWSWSRYSGWSPLRAGDPPPWGSICPYEKLSQELRHAWQCDVSPVSGEYRLSRDEWLQLESLTQRLAEYALINKLAQDGGGYALEWKISSQLEQLLDALTAFQSELELKQGIAWLTGIEEGLPPWDSLPLSEGAQLGATPEQLFLTKWMPTAAA